MDKYIRANIVFSKFSRENRELKRYLPIRPSEMGALNIIIRHEGDVTPLAIAECLGVSKPMIAAHLQALEEKGYIYKETSADDKRSFYVRPTEAGRELAKEFETKQREYMKKVEEHLGDGEFDELVRLLEAVHRILHDMREDPESAGLS